MANDSKNNVSGNMNRSNSAPRSDRNQDQKRDSQQRPQSGQERRTTGNSTDRTR